MFITLEADYAVRIVSVLCREKDKMDAKTISNDACVTLRFALKILRKLVAADIVKSYKGTQGGYIINKDPAQLTLKDVLEAIEGTYYFSCVLLLIADTRVVILHKKVPFASFSSQVPLQLK